MTIIWRQPQNKTIETFKVKFKFKIKRVNSKPIFNI